MKKLGLLAATAVAAITIGSSTAGAQHLVEGYPPPPPPVAPAPGGGGTLPATGSDSAPTAQIAAGLVAAGIGLGVVGGVRRRRHTTA